MRGLSAEEWSGRPIEKGLRVSIIWMNGMWTNLSH